MSPCAPVFGRGARILRRRRLASARMTGAAPPRVTIALAVHDAAPLLLRCLSALARLPDELGFEVVVVDDASTDATPGLLEHVEGDFVALRNDRPLGFGPSCDRAVEAARADVVVLLAEDVVPVDGWLEPLLLA